MSSRQGLTGPFTDPAALELGHAGHHGEHHPAGGGGGVHVRQIAEQEAPHPIGRGLTAQAQHQLGIAGDPIELGHRHSSPSATGFRQSSSQLGAIGLPSALHLGELGHQLSPPLSGQLLHLGPLGLQPQAALALALGAHAVVGDQLHGRGSGGVRTDYARCA